MVLEALGPDGQYHSRLLGPPDLRSLQALFERATDHFELATGQPPGRDEASRAFVAGPPSKQVHDKRVIGIFTRQDALVGVIDALTDWPEPATWSMGILLVDPTHRGRGLGSAALAEYECWARACGAKRFRTAVVSHHVSGIRFLEGTGYLLNRRVENPEAGGNHTAILFFEKHA
jgi:GNAT superfamily N-acetyltransferase